MSGLKKIQENIKQNFGKKTTNKTTKTSVSSNQSARKQGPVIILIQYALHLGQVRSLNGKGNRK